MFISWVHFMSLLLISGFVIRFTQMHLISKDSTFGKALAYIY